MNVAIVRRADVPSIHSVLVDGREHTLGILKEFWKNETLFSFLPKDSRVAIAWVHLDAGEALDPHVHPVDSMILICAGKVKTTGDLEAEMLEGDVMLVPKGRKHGFVGAGDQGFWGLSMQFDARGLYEDLADPWASFASPAGARSDHATGDAVAMLLARNEEYLDAFAKHRLFTIAERGHFANPEIRKRFLDCFQVWSNYFQRMVQARAALSDTGPHADLAHAHLEAELGHNVQLAKATRGRCVWDPLLESTCAWFPWRITTTSDVGRLVLVHLVVEGSATIFYKKMAPHIPDPESGEHFGNHLRADDGHMQVGVEVLQRSKIANADELLEIQRQGWEMLRAMFGRIADLVMR